MDSMANVTSVNDLSLLTNVVWCDVPIHTSNGLITAKQMGSLKFYIKDSVSISRDIEILNVLYLPPSGGILLPVSTLLQLGFRPNFQLNILHDMVESKNFEFHCIDGLYFCPILPIKSSDSHVFSEASSSTIPDSRVSSVNVDYRSPRWSCQILKALFLEFDYARGPFYVDVLQNPTDRILKEFIKGDAFKAPLYGNSFFINMVFDPKFCIRMLEYLDTQFLLDPHNTVYGIFIIQGKNMPYNYLLNKYEQWGDVILAGTTNICTVPVREHFTKAKTLIVDGFPFAASSIACKKGNSEWKYEFQT